MRDYTLSGAAPYILLGILFIGALLAISYVSYNYITNYLEQEEAEEISAEEFVAETEFVDEITVRQNISIEGNNAVVAGHIDELNINNYTMPETTTVAEVPMTNVAGPYDNLAKYGVYALLVIVLGTYLIIKQVFRYKEKTGM